MTRFAKLFNGRESKTVAEAKRKKKFSLIGIILCVVLVILSFVLAALLQSATVALNVLKVIIVIAVSGILFFWLKLICARKEIFKLNNLYCSECGERFTYDKSVYTKLKENVLSSKSGDHINVDTYAVVKINCTCGKCGSKHDFEYDFLISRKQTNSMGAALSERTYSIEERMMDFFND